MWLLATLPPSLVPSLVLTLTSLFLSLVLICLKLIVCKYGIVYGRSHLEIEKRHRPCHDGCSLGGESCR